MTLIKGKQYQMVVVPEAYIERKTCEYAKSLGWLNYKFVSPNNRGVPDRIFLRNKRVAFIEFKATGKVPTKLQWHKINAIQEQDFTVVVIDSIVEGKRFFDFLEVAHAKQG